MEEKVLLIKVETEERERGSGFMKSVKKRWSNKARTKKTFSAQKLVDNARRFKLEDEVMGELEGRSEKPKSEAPPESMHWTTAKNVRLIETEEMKRGLGFMKRVGDRWEQKLGERLKDPKLRDNTARYKSRNRLRTLSW